MKTKRRTRDAILESAINLFSESGFSAVSIRDITRRIGIKESSLYNHFRSKNEILGTIVEEFKQSYGEVMFVEESIKEELEDAKPEAFFKRQIMKQREHLTPRQQKIYKIVWMEQFRNRSVRDFFFKEMIGRPAAYYEKVFRHMTARGLIKPVSPKTLSDEYSYALMALTLEFILLETDHKDSSLIANKIFSHIKFICQSIERGG